MPRVLLDSIEKVKIFVNTVSKIECEVFLKSGRYIIDAKSIMGIFSLDLTKPMEIDFSTDCDTYKKQCMDLIKEFVV